jgi:glucose 1-dehydrogenase
VEVTEGLQERVAGGAARGFGMQAAERVRREPHLVDVGGAVGAVPEMALETTTIMRRHRAFDVVGDQLDRLPAGEIAEVPNQFAQRAEDTHALSVAAATRARVVLRTIAHMTPSHGSPIGFAETSVTRPAEPGLGGHGHAGRARRIDTHVDGTNLGDKEHDMQGLYGKTALVTGGSSGIGQAIATRLGHAGVNVAINYVGPLDGAVATKAAIERGVDACVREVNECSQPSRAIVVEADVSDEAEVERMYKEVRSEFGTVDFLVNNAGIQIAQDSDMLDAAAFDRVLAVNLRGSFLCAREQVRQLLADDRPGAIVNVSSVHQLIPKPKFLGYSVSKGGMQNLTRTLALEYAGRGIRVNGIGPGATVTPINRAWIDDPEKRAMVTSHIPMGRAGDAEEMAATAAFLLSDEAGYITGQTIFVDGGLTLFADFRGTWSSE